VVNIASKASEPLSVVAKRGVASLLQVVSFRALGLAARE